MGQGFIERVSAAGVVEGFDAQGHDCEPIRERQASFSPILNLSPSTEATGPACRNAVRGFAIGRLPNRRQGQGSMPVDLPRRARVRSMPDLAKISATPRVVSRAID